MRTDFQRWSYLKEKISGLKSEDFSYKEGEVWWCYLGLNVGTEQNGAKNTYLRPVLVLKIIDKKSFFAVPLTTSKKRHRYRIPMGDICNKPGTALVSKMRMLDVKRLKRYMTTVEEESFYKIRRAVRRLF